VHDGNAMTRSRASTPRPKARTTRKGHGSATLDDVARRAGVSAITVSRALRAPHLVAATTRDRIAAAVHEVGYIPNRIAGSLASTASSTVAAILPTLDNSIFTDVLKGMVAALERSGLQLVLGNSHWELAVEAALVETFLAHRVGAIMLTGARHAPRTRKLLEDSGVAVVETWSLPSNPIGACVGFSNSAAAYAMTRHLVERGYRDIAFVSAPVRNNDRAAARRQGYAQALADHGLSNDPRTTLESPFGLADGATALKQIRTLRPSTDAVFFANDVLAAGAVLGALRAGIRVPDEIAIAGFDDLELAAHVQPPLTTVRVDRHRIGAAAADLVLAALRGEDIRGNRVDVGFEIVVRAST
jgi:LacI family transcriptional regulator, gluconate utilization system Gnt-I transcriptional repressor